MYKSGQRTWRAGNWLMQDEESGKTCYAKELVRDYKGLWVRKKYADREHPQDFVKGLNDPRPIPYSHPFPRAGHICNFPDIFVGKSLCSLPEINSNKDIGSRKVSLIQGVPV